MRKLELKDICSYLPYELYYQIDNGKITTYDDYTELRRLLSYTPILRPMSDLTKPITHKGETFVPIVELAKINEPEYTSIEINDKGRVFINTPYVENMTMVYDSINAIFLNLTIRKDGSYMLETSRAARNQQPLFDKLSEWLFDYRDLIGQGLALPVTEEFNPYK